MIDLLFLFILISGVPQALSERPNKDYCTMKCNGTDNFVCERKNDCSPKVGCKNIPITPKFRGRVLRIHNEYRQKIAKGAFHGYIAKSMNAISYDLELEYMAACWAYTCPWKIDFTQVCFRSDRFKAVGSMGHLADHVRDDVNTTISFWYEEGLKFFSEERFLKNAKRCMIYEHALFLNLAFAEIEYVGCAHSRHGDRQTNFVCVYAPGADDSVPGPIFRYTKDIEDAGSACKKRNKKFPALCGDIGNVPDEPCWAGGSVARGRVLSNFFAVIFTIFLWGF